MRVTSPFGFFSNRKERKRQRSNWSKSSSSSSSFTTKREASLSTSTTTENHSSRTTKTLAPPVLQKEKEETSSLLPIENIQQQQQTLASSSSSILATADNNATNLNSFQSLIVKLGMISFILSMCLALPLTLFPQQLLLRLGFISKRKSERWALCTGQFCARWLLRFIPFCRIDTINHNNNNNNKNHLFQPVVVQDSTSTKPAPPGCIWVCNHTSMLDVFILLAADFKLRGPKRRPIKIIYWKQLEDNPITKLLFQQCGFIPVQMAANAAGETNVYDRSSFKTLLKEAKRAISQGFDLGILPEGQLNPNPEKGLLPILTGAYTISKLASPTSKQNKLPIFTMALQGIQYLWHPQYGMKPTRRRVHVRAYPIARHYTSSQDFVDTFTHIVGYFGQYGHDVHDWKQWLIHGGGDEEESHNDNQEEEKNV